MGVNGRIGGKSKTMILNRLLSYLNEHTPVFIVDGNRRFDINSPLLDGVLDRFVDDIKGITGGGIEISLAEKEDWE